MIDLIMRKISYFIDSEKITVNKEFDLEELNEDLDVFDIRLDRDIVKLDLGQGTIMIDRAQFEAVLEKYHKQCLELSARHHFDKLNEILNKGNPQEKSLARACIRNIIKEMKLKE